MASNKASVSVTPKKSLSGTSAKKKASASKQFSAMMKKTASLEKVPLNTPAADDTNTEEQVKPAVYVPDGLDQAPVGSEADIIYVNDTDLEDDPLNADYYGSLEELENMAESMKTYGFQGVILAYPIEGGKYRIQSGHRRRAAGRIAGLTEFPILKTTPPKDEWERKMRLFLGNLHGRKEKPTTVAKVAQGLFEVHQQEIKQKREQGLLREGDETHASVLVGKDLDISYSSVEKYRQLLKLSRGLQEMADSGICPWSELSAASTLTEKEQADLFAVINEKISSDGEDSIDRPWLKAEVKRIKEGKKKVRKERTRDEVKLLIKGAKNVREVLFSNHGFTGKDRNDVIRELRELKECLEQKLEELEKDTD